MRESLPNPLSFSVFSFLGCSTNGWNWRLHFSLWCSFSLHPAESWRTSGQTFPMGTFLTLGSSQSGILGLRGPQSIFPLCPPKQLMSSWLIARISFNTCLILSLQFGQMMTGWRSFLGRLWKRIKRKKDRSLPKRTRRRWDRRLCFHRTLFFLSFYGNLQIYVQKQSKHKMNS